MTIRSISPSEYRALFPPEDSHLFNSVDFAELNAGRCDRIHYLVFADSKVRFGLIAGEREGKLFAPFSAPFASFSYNSLQSIDAVDAAVDALGRYGMPVQLFLPPTFYDPLMLPKFESALLRKATLLYSDLNYHISLKGFNKTDWTPEALARVGAKARPRLKAALKTPFEVTHRADPARAYAVIAANRAHKGYPLRMTLEQVLATAPLACTEFIVMSLEGQDVASAVVYHTAPGIMQVVYWGDAPGFEALHPMQRFAYEVMHRCASLGSPILDIGPASEDGIPSPGLCTFKESIGCTPTLKPKFLIQ